MTKTRKGIILAGGTGTRLHPATIAVSKQLLPVFDKPMIYHPLSVLMLSNIRDVLIISTPQDLSRFVQLLDTGEQWGMNFQYAVQENPDGLAQAITIGASFIGEDDVTLILGDNIFHGHGLPELLTQAGARQNCATVFACHVPDPQRYGVVEFDAGRRAVSLEEKPLSSRSNFAVTGLYFYDNEVIKFARSLTPSARCELEITDLNRLYLERGRLHVEIIGRGFAWFDAGTHETLLQAGQFVATLEQRQGMKIACPEEIAFSKGWINAEKLDQLADALGKTGYGQYLKGLLADRFRL